MSKYSEFKNAENELQKFANEKQKELRKLENELQGLIKKFESMESPGEKDKLKKKSIDKQKKFVSFQQEAREEIQNKQVELKEPLVNKIKETIYEYAQDKNYDYILTRFSLTYANESHDITQEIINILNNPA